jgi:hypothetical protein
MGLLVGLAVMAATLGLVILAAQPPAPRDAAAPADQFSAVRARVALERLLSGDTPHPIGSDANARIAARIGDELAALGYAVETQDAFACRVAWGICGSVTNVLTRLPGETEGPAVLLTAHYDSVPAASGAADDMAGVAVMLEIARSLREGEPRRIPVVFLFSDGEEVALLGAEAFMAEHPRANDVGAVVNLEANGTHGQSVLFQTTGESGWLIDTFAAHAPRPVTSSAYDAIYALLPFNTDLTVYGEAGLPGLNFAFIEEHPQYHTPLDALANLSPGSLQHHGDNALAAVRALGAADLANPPSGRSVYQDVPPGVVLRWPEPWSLPLAAATAIGWAGVGVAAYRRGALAWRSLLWGLLALPLGVAGAALLGLGLASLVQAATGAALPWYAHPIPLRIAIGAAATTWTVLVASVLARRAGFWGIFLGVWIWWAALSALVAALLPGVSPLALLPTILAALAAGVVTVSPLRASPHACQAAALAGLVGAGWFWLGFTRGSDYSALGPDLGVTVGFAVGLTASALAPLVAPATTYGRVWRPALGGAALLIVAATGVATQVPPSSDERPLRLNVQHVQERQAGHAWWALDTLAPLGSGELGQLQDLLRAGGFDGETAALFPWSPAELLAAPAPMIEADPILELVSDENEQGNRLVTVELHSPRPEERVTVYVPMSVRLLGVAIPTESITLAGIPVEDDFGRFHCVGAACDGLRLELRLEYGGSTTLYAARTSPGLPEGGEALVAARPSIAAPSGGGDASVVIDRVILDASAAP